MFLIISQRVDKANRKKIKTCRRNVKFILALNTLNCQNSRFGYDRDIASLTGASLKWLEVVNIET